MKIVEINGTNYSSTGNIMLNIAKQAGTQGIEVFTCCKDSKKSKQFNYDNQLYIGNRFERIICEELVYFNGKNNYYNYLGTKQFINKLKKINPDLIHLHIMHDTYINLKMLFDYIKENNIPVVWTMHDCWAFTGRCPYFESNNCFKWKDGCRDCPRLDKYPITLCDQSKLLWNKKREWFGNVKNMTIVTPSNWLRDYVKESFLKDYDCRVIYNGIDLNKFKPIKTDFKKKYGIQNRYVVLGVGYNWTERKGLDDIIKLSKSLDSKYQVVIVGTNKNIDKTLPNNIISIHRTYNLDELVEIYSCADVFVNPTKEDNLPTVNIEALACGTPVLTYKTGGSPEVVDNKSGSVVEKGDVESLKKEVIRICEDKPYSEEDCISRAKQFDATNRYNDYIELYKQILNKK